MTLFKRKTAAQANNQAAEIDNNQDNQDTGGKSNTLRVVLTIIKYIITAILGWLGGDAMGL